MMALKKTTQRVLMLTLALAASTHAHAQNALTKAEAALAGRWEIAHADDTPDHCALLLLADETIGGRQVVLGKTCMPALPWTGEITAWRLQPDGAVVLADALRHAVIAFRRDTAGDLQGVRPDGAAYVLYPVKAGKARR